MSPARKTVDRLAIPAAVLRLCEQLREYGHVSWVVGGCVRDHLLGRVVEDWDLCTTAQPRQVMKIFPRTIPVGIEHGTVKVMVGADGYEVTTLRGETTYSDGRRPDSVFFVRDVTDDLARRDFTVNAIAYDPLEERLVDPFGGLDDLERGVLRAVGDARARFAEDGLRVLRAARFVATLEFDLDPATGEAIAPNIDTFRKVSPERVREEWIKTMKAAQPSRAFRIMQQTGILGVVCPALQQCVGCDQEADRDGDVWEHSLRALDHAPRGHAILRLAALMHDCGKPRARTVDPASGVVSFEEHDRLGAEIADEFMRAYRFSNDEREQLVHLVRHHRVRYEPTWTDGDVRRHVQRVGLGSWPLVLALRRADLAAQGTSAAEALRNLEQLAHRVERTTAAGVALTVRDLAINGGDLQRELGIPPSRRLGDLLKTLLERVIDEPRLNDRESLLELARQLSDPPSLG